MSSGLQEIEQAIRCNKVYRRMNKLKMCDKYVERTNIDTSDALLPKTLSKILHVNDIFSNCTQWGDPSTTNLTYVRWFISPTDIHKLYIEHYDMFCHLEKLLIPKTYEFKALNIKIANLEKTISDLETKITYMPSGAGYENAKQEFEVLKNAA